MVFCHQGQGSYATGTVSKLDKSLSVTLDLLAVISYNNPQFLENYLILVEFVSYSY